MKALILAAGAALALPAMAQAHDGLAIKDHYILSANPKTAAAYMVVENHRAVGCKLKGVSSEAAKRVQIHTVKEENDVAKMVRVRNVTIPASGTHVLAPGGDHVMLMGLEEPLENGDTVAVALDFGDCGETTIDIMVDNTRKGPREIADGHEGHEDHNMAEEAEAAEEPEAAEEEE